MGGDCLNVGCVPSKSLIAAAAAAQAQRAAGPFGIAPVTPQRRLRRGAPARPRRDRGHRPARQRRAVRGAGGDGDPRARPVHRRRTWSRPAGSRSGRAASSIATGSRPAVPAVPGLAGVPHLTNETRVRPRRSCRRRLLVLGGGPIGCELAQAFRRLGRRGGAGRPGSDPAQGRPGADRGGPRAAAGRGRELHEHAEVLAAEPGPALVIESRRRPAAPARHASAGGRRPQGQCRGARPRGVAGIAARPARASRSTRGCAPPTRGCSRSATWPAGSQLTHLASYQAGDRDPQRPVPAAGAGQHPRDPLGDLHRSRARRGGPERGRRAGAGHRARGRPLAVRRQ